jgi:hypothetical protein
MRTFSLIAIILLISCSKEKKYFQNGDIVLTETDIIDLNYKFKSDTQKIKLISEHIIPEYKKYVFARDYNEYDVNFEAIRKVAISKAYSENLLNDYIKNLITDTDYISKIYNYSLNEFRYDHITILKSISHQENEIRSIKINNILDTIKQDELKFDELKRQYGVNTDKMVNNFYTWGGSPYAIQLEIYKKSDKGIIFDVIETSKAYHIIKVLDFKKKTNGFYPNLELFKKDYLAEQGLKVKEVAAYQDYYWIKIYKENNVRYFYDKVNEAYQLLKNSNLIDIYEMKVDNIGLFEVQDQVFSLHDLLYFNLGNLNDFVDHVRVKSHLFVPNYVDQLMTFQVRKLEAEKLRLTDINKNKVNKYLYNQKYNYIEKLYSLKNEKKLSEEEMRKYYKKNSDEFQGYDRRFTYGFYLEGDDVEILKKDYPKMTVKNLINYYNKYFKYKKKEIPFLGMFSHMTYKNLSKEVFKLKRNELSSIIRLEGTGRYYVCYFNKEEKGTQIVFEDARESIKQRLIYESKRSLQENFYRLIDEYNKNSMVTL